MNGFGGWDWAIFVLSLCASLGTGLWAAYISKRNLKKGDTKANASEFLMGGRNMNPIAVALSTMIGAVSSNTVLGNPAETYAYGTQYWLNLIGMTFGMVYVHFIILKVLYPLKITSVYTYIEKRFKSRGLSTFTVFTTLIGTFFFMGLCSYCPALAMETVTGFPAWASSLILGVICTIYASLGGVRSVVYTDILQTFVLFTGVLFILIRSSIDAGGISGIWSIAQDHGRIEFWNFNPDPLQRHSFWLVNIQGYFSALLVFGMGQPQVQRVCSVSTWKKALGAYYLNYAVLFIVYLCLYFTGLAVFAVYADCDPMATGDIVKPDQLLPYYVDDKLSYLPGISGLFVAALFAAALSTYSSQINAVSAVMWEGLLKNSKWVENMDENRKPLVNVGVSVITGMAGVAASIIASQLGGIFQIGQTILGAIHAPLLGLFILGMCCPFANKIGGTVGFTVSIIFNFWVTIGSMLYGKGTPFLGFDDDGCDYPTTEFVNSTWATTPAYSSTTESPEDDYTFPLYLISYTLYALCGTSITFFVGTIVSLLTKPWPADVSGKEYIHPAFYKLMKIWEKKASAKQRLLKRTPFDAIVD
ncbi:sodium-coupled monocarboxylate transporter 1-like [Palaemon carinicauda]|uniref:sodium-coupled monocarboxylate transporter 1-like n=1 Tax=Palaemon carinicauda TaxID=392227 RepID=UPI0035B58020